MLPYIGASDLIPGSAHWTECTSFCFSSFFLSKRQFSGLKGTVQNAGPILYVFVQCLMFVQSPHCPFSQPLPFGACFGIFGQTPATSLSEVFDPGQIWPSVIFSSVQCIPWDCNALYFIECHLPCLSHCVYLFSTDTYLPY